MNRQAKRQMAKQGADKPRTPEQRRQAANPQTERTGPRAVPLRGAGRDEEGRVAAARRDHELDGRSSSIGLVVMTTLIFVFDWLAGGIVNYIFK